MLRVRRATEEDLVDLFKLSVLMQRETDFSAFSFNPEKTINSISEWLQGNAVFVADDGDEIVGMLAASKRTHAFSDDEVACEDVFFVRQDKRGTRAGYLLMKSFIEWAGDSGARHVRAGVSTGTGSAAERLYQHFGMKHMGGNFSLHLG
jgi:GNAT superfamily N-acetyltransferase